MSASVKCTSPEGTPPRLMMMKRKKMIPSVLKLDLLLVLPMDRIASQSLPIKKKSWSVLNRLTLQSPQQPSPPASKKRTDGAAIQCSRTMCTSSIICPDLSLLLPLSPPQDAHQDLLLIRGIFDKDFHPLHAHPFPLSGGNSQETRTTLKRFGASREKNICKGISRHADCCNAIYPTTPRKTPS